MFWDATGQTSELHNDLAWGLKIGCERQGHERVFEFGGLWFSGLFYGGGDNGGNCYSGVGVDMCGNNCNINFYCGSDIVKSENL